MTSVREIGEFGLIDRLQAVLPASVRQSAALPLGIGDDAAVFQLPEASSLVVTTDAMVDRIHFRLDWTDWRSLGHKLLAVNLSDLAAMGATPLACTVTLGLTGSERVADLEAMYRGLGRLAEAFGIVVAGGDVVRSPEACFFDLTAFGSVPNGQEVRRSGARPGDVIVVSGTLGAAAAGMVLLERGDRAAATADLLIAAHLRPLPRLALGALMREHGVSAAMDLSDGLYGDLPKLLGRSGVAAEIDPQRIPVAAAVRALFPDRWLELATTGGEDYELLMTVPEERLPGFAVAADAVGATLTAIGQVVEGSAGAVRLAGGGTVTPAWDHFG